MWIIGIQQFCGHPLHVDPGVYVPRLQSEDLALPCRRVLDRTGGPAVDLCTGCGPVAAHLLAAVPAAQVVGVEIDPGAAACARRNGVPVLLGDLAEPLRSLEFGLVTAVAPYVPTGELGTLPRDVQHYEPARALNGGSDGLDLVRRIVVGSARILRPGGWLLLEIGGAQDEVLALVARGRRVRCADHLARSGR